jgi:hypothetical protein
LPGLSEQRSEDDDIARRHVPADRSVGSATVDDPLHGPVHLVAHGQGFLDGCRRPAMERQHEFVTLSDRCLDEAPQRVAGGRAVALGRPHVREHLLEGTVGKEVKQVLAGTEVAVKRPDADARVGRDGRHGDVRPLTVHGRGRGTDERFVVAGRVAALFVWAPSRDGHALIEPALSPPWGDRYTEADEILRMRSARETACPASLRPSRPTTRPAS